ncbi:MAG: hypothetical protein QOD00_3050 [Blastocatellia bacterium]|jgi:hypothetical protein|nr:hypothetical protein [Blastocatellia bacterium]
MGGMKTSMKISLIIIALALLAFLVVLRWRPDEPVGASVSNTSGGPSFAVRVVMPRSALPLFGLLPERLAAHLDGTPRESGFDHASRGAKIGSVGPDRLELSADGWALSIETGGEGRITTGTRLVFPLALGGRQVKLRCRPADRATGYLRTTTRAGSDELDGRFLVELATCENAETGKAIEWPPAPLTVRGSFVGLPHGVR